MISTENNCSLKRKYNLVNTEKQMNIDLGVLKDYIKDWKEEVYKNKHVKSTRFDLN